MRKLHLESKNKNETPTVSFMDICCWDVAPSAVMEGAYTLGKRYRS